MSYVLFISEDKLKAKQIAINPLHGIAPYIQKKGEEYMNEKQGVHFKSILSEWKKELMEEVDRTVTHMKDEAANFPDPADRATQEEEFSLELRTRDRERKLIKKIELKLRVFNKMVKILLFKFKKANCHLFKWLFAFLFMLHFLCLTCIFLLLRFKQHEHTYI